jgi:hypothetical protein
MNEAVLNKLERRLDRLQAKLRLGIEMDHEEGHAVRDNRRRESFAEGCWWRRRLK